MDGNSLGKEAPNGRRYIYVAGGPFDDECWELIPGESWVKLTVAEAEALPANVIEFIEEFLM